MDSLQLWILVGSIACLLAAWLGYRALLRSKGRRRARRERLEAAAWAEAQRLVNEKAARHRARQEAAAQQAARDAAAEAARIEAVKAAAAEAERAQAFRLAVEEAARAEAHAEALRRAEDEAARDRLAREAAQESARLEVERLAAESEALNASLNAPPTPPATPRPVTIVVPDMAAIPAVVVVPKTPEETLVMVADDSKIVRVKTGRLLTQHGYRVAFATDGLEAVQQIEASMPDIVITDVDMPGMDGFELTRQVRQNPRTRHIPVIMITAADDRHRDDADRAGVSVLLGKPYPEDELMAHIRRAMNRDAAMAATHA